MRFLRAVALGYDVGTRFTMTIGVGRISERESPEHARHRGDFRIGRGGSFGGRAQRAADALGARLRVAASFRHQSLAARYRPYRESLRVRGHARAQRSFRRRNRRLRRHGRGRCSFRPGQFPAGLCAASRSGEAGRQARRALRDRTDQHQEVERGLADPSAARCSGESAQEASLRGGPSAIGHRARRHQRSGAGEQSRDAGHLSAVHGCGDAARQDRVFPIRRTTKLVCKMPPSSASAPKCN